MGIRTQLATFFRSPGAREQDRQHAIVALGRANSPEEEISRRETQRLAHMSADDQAWEQAALQRNRAAQDGLLP